MARAARLVCARRQLTSFLWEGLFHAGSSARECKRNKVGHCASRPGQQCRAIDPALPLQFERKRDAGNPFERWGRNGNRNVNPRLCQCCCQFRPGPDGQHRDILGRRPIETTDLSIVRSGAVYVASRLLGWPSPITDNRYHERLYLLVANAVWPLPSRCACPINTSHGPQRAVPPDLL
jgi:hypothetical protein